MLQQLRLKRREIVQLRSLGPAISESINLIRNETIFRRASIANNLQAVSRSIAVVSATEGGTDFSRLGMEPSEIVQKCEYVLATLTQGTYSIGRNHTNRWATGELLPLTGSTAEVPLAFPTHLHFSHLSCYPHFVLHTNTQNRTIGYPFSFLFPRKTPTYPPSATAFNGINGRRFPQASQFGTLSSRA